MTPGLATFRAVRAPTWERLFMSDSYALRRRDAQHPWAWFAFGLIVLVTVLALFVLPRRSSRVEVGSRGPTVRPQSDTRPMPPPAVARTRGLAA